MLGLGFIAALRSISELKSTSALRKLAIYGCKKISDLDCIGELKHLEELSLMSVPLSSARILSPLRQLRFLRLESVGKISSLSFLGDMKALEELWLVGGTVVEDGDMSILLKLPTLNKVVYVDRRHYSHRNDDVMAELRARGK